MGSYTEGNLSFDFAESTPDHVLAAFSALATGDQPPSAPPLPPPVVEAWDMWEPDWRLMGLPDGEGDPFEDEPWRHNWADAVSLDMGPLGPPHGRLVWNYDRWHLDCRFSWKCDPWTVSDALAWLGRYVTPGYMGRKAFVGYALDEGNERPYLFWVLDGRWELENLNPPEEWE